MIGRAIREIAYCGIGAVFGVAGVALLGLWLLPSAVAVLSVVGTVVGLVGLVGGLHAARFLTTLQRWALARFTGTAIAAPPRPEHGRGIRGRLGQRLRDRAGWRTVACLLLRLPVAAVQSYVVLLGVVGALDLLLPVAWPLPHLDPTGRPVRFPVPPFAGLAVRTWSEALLASPLGLALLVAAALLARPAVTVDAWLARLWLGRGNRHRRGTPPPAVDGPRQAERDPHDGAQVRPASLAIHLDLARRTAGADTPNLTALGELLDTAPGDAAGATADPRDPTRGLRERDQDRCPSRVTDGDRRRRNR